MPNSKKPLIRLYSLSTFDRGAKARWLLTEIGIEFEQKWLNRDKKENETEAYLKLNPMGRVPVLEYGDQVMFESGAICAFLADQFLEKGMAPAHSAPERSEYLKWVFFASSLDAYQARIMVIEDIPAGELQKKKEAALQSDLRDAMESMNAVLSKRDYLASDRFTAADIGVGYHLYFLKMWPELDSVIAEFPKVAAYFERLQAMPSAVKSKAFSYPS
jgi:glutathione S-transferase